MKALLNVRNGGVRAYITIYDEARLSSKKSFIRSYLGATEIRRKSTFYGLVAEYKVVDDLSDQNVSIVLKHDKGTPTQTK